MTMTASLLPTPTDWFAARMAVLDQDLIARLGDSPELVAKDAADLLPGDGYVTRGQARVCTGFPDVDATAITAGIVSIPNESDHDSEHIVGTMLVTWRARAINYGLVRCRQCQVNVRKDHSPQECLTMQQERAYKRMGDW